MKYIEQYLVKTVKIKKNLIVSRRYFINETALRTHFTTKVHKRRLKALELEPYSIKESERAASKGNYITPQKRKIETVTRGTFNEKDADAAPKAKAMKIDE